jgi:hypothetical protein
MKEETMHQVVQSKDLEIVEGRTISLLVHVDQTRGAACHIPVTSGRALCKRELKLSLWRIEERLVDETLICNICRVKQAKLARS